MAIGSGADLGVVFGRWGDKNERERDLWCATFRERFGDNLLKGNAKLDYPKRNEVADGDTNPSNRIRP